MRFVLLILILLTMPAAAVFAADVAEKKEKRDSISALKKLTRHFTDIDTSYIEPQHYNWAVMGQATASLDFYTLRSSDGQSITFRPRSQFKLGPYFGYRWMFLGYTFDISHLTSDNRKEYDLSIYSNLMGFDLYYRKSGSQYYIRRATFGNVNTRALRGTQFDGFQSSVRGFNIYYIFNHHRFSYPAAFSQSTVQRHSAGSAMIGLSHTRHSLSIDWDELDKVIDAKLGAGVSENAVDTALHFSKVSYDAYSISGGYAYNWVFARNWLLSTGLSVALAYNQSSGDADRKFLDFKFQNFSFKNFNIDNILRIALVWNNTKWFGGLSGVLHSFNYSKSTFRTNNSFGTISLYFGMNFGRMKEKQKQKKR